MRTLHHDGARREIIERLHRLTPTSERRWGEMSITKLMCHLGDQLRMALGDIPVKKHPSPFHFRPLGYLIIHVLPWPKGRAKAPPEAFTTPSTTWDADRERLLELIARFASTPMDRLSRMNPVFGKLSGRDWSVLSYRHLDHHLRQFGA